jgi:hypothetical protein
MAIAGLYARGPKNRYTRPNEVKGPQAVQVIGAHSEEHQKFARPGMRAFQKMIVGQARSSLSELEIGRDFVRDVDVHNHQAVFPVTTRSIRSAVNALVAIE